MEFLKRAEQYAEAHGDEFWFKHYFSVYREQFSVLESTWKTLAWLYDDKVADLLELQ